MKDHPNQEADIIPKVMSFFGIAAPKEVIAVTEGLGNHNYEVVTARGIYFVKFLVTQKPASVENDVAIQNQLKTAGIKTPIYLRGHALEYIYSDQNMKAVVAKKIEGVTPRNDYVDKNLAFAIGRVLAIFHLSVTKLPIPAKTWLDPEVLGIDPKIAGGLFNSALPSGITHGDMHLGNILVDPIKRDKIKAILDFEEVGRGPLVVDLARSVLGVCNSTDDQSLVPELIAAELAGYESVRKLSKDEKRLLPQAVNYAADACIKWFADHGYNKYIESYRNRASSFKLPSDTT